ncbi:MAG: hypothetical protein LBF58_10915, partial [Deltaproteobacteria bacterium]|nr:hypothetical protein [Deltaproteobacteria bacterium]
EPDLALDPAPDREFAPEPPPALGLKPALELGQATARDLGLEPAREPDLCLDWDWKDHYLSFCHLLFLKILNNY